MNWLNKKGLSYNYPKEGFNLNTEFLACLVTELTVDVMGGVCLYYEDDNLMMKHMFVVWKMENGALIHLNFTKARENYCG